MARRATVVSAVQVDCPPAEVFAYLAGVARHGDWPLKAYRVEGVAPGEQMITGTRFTSYGWLPNDRNHRNDVEATDVFSHRAGWS